MISRSRPSRQVHLAWDLQVQRPARVSASWGLSRKTQPLPQVVTSRQYRRGGYDLDIAVEVPSKVDSMAAKAVAIVGGGSKVGMVAERTEVERRTVDEPRKGEFDPGQDYIRPALDLRELDLGQPKATEGSQRRSATLSEAELKDMVVGAVP